MTRLQVFLSACVLFAAAATTGSSEAAPKGDAKSATPTPAADDGPAFDRQAATAALTAIELQKCKKAQPKKGGEGHVMVTFTPGGSVSNAVVDRGPWVGTPAAKCIAKEFKKAKIPSFKGDAVLVGKLIKVD